MTPRGAKITVLTWLKDEEHIIPFFLRHYAFADRIIAWDNGSTDRSREMLAANPRVEIRDWDTGGLLRDDQLLQMKNEEYRKTGPGWNFIVDIDEFVWHPFILPFLDECDARGITLPQTQGFDMVSLQMPADDGVTPLTDLVKEGRPNPMYNKISVLRDTCHILYWYGAHRIHSMSGRVIVSDQAYLKLLHYRYLSCDLVIEKAKRIRLSPQNIQLQVGLFQASPEAQRGRWEETWAGKITVLP